MSYEVALIFFFPLLVAIGCCSLPQFKRKIHLFALTASLLYLVLSLKLFFMPESLDSLVELGSISLSHFFGLSYGIAIDGLSGILLLLNSFLLVVVVLTTRNIETDKLRLYYFCLFFLSWTVAGALLSSNLYTFYLFWESMLIPLFLLINVFGGEKRAFTSKKFFLYTAAGSFIMLGAMFYLSQLAYENFGTYNLTTATISQLNLPFNGFCSPQSLVFWAFTLAMLIKIPAFPFHSWLPDAHVQAPTAGSILLAGILLKLGVYGLLRFVIPLYPDAAMAYRPLLMLLGGIGVVYGALIALNQTDIKKLVAFSSISHMGYIVAAVFAFQAEALSGAIFQMISHGLTTSGLFVAVHCLYSRFKTKDIQAFGGLAQKMPVFAVVFFIMLLGSMAVPLTNGFVGEFLIIWGVYKANLWGGILCATGVILGPLYLFKLYQNVMLGPLTNDKPVSDISNQELLPFVLLGIFIIFYGVYPQSLINFYEGYLLAAKGLGF